MRVIADKYIPYLQGLLDEVADVQYLSPAEITPAIVREADALFVRTRTRCNGALLDGSKVRWVGTATIGFDHIDTAYCEAHGIAWTNAPGCNAQGVADYVESALNDLGYLPRAHQLTIGIVGVGHVGKLVEQMARRHGFRVLLCDPPRALAEGADGFVTMTELAREADIVTFHTPYSAEGPFATRHLCDASFLEQLRPSTLIINAARGGIVDEEALLTAANPCVIDCWEGEPNVNRRLLEVAQLGTFHIAGYTQWGKYRASQQVLEAFSAFFGLKTLVIQKKYVPLQAESIFSVRALSEQLKSKPGAFEELREAYPLR